MRKKRPFKLLILSLLFLALSIYLIFNFPPSFQFSVFNFQFSILAPTLAILFLFIFFLVSFLLNNKRRGLFVAIFVLGYLILKLLNLTNPFFIILLLILLTMLELLFTKRK